MGVFKGLGKKISDKGKELSQKARIMSETSSLNNVVRGEECKIDYQYKSMGKLYFEKYGDAPAEEFAKACEAIKDSMEKIEQIKAEIVKIKARFNCPNCGSPFKHGSVFCSKCGAKLPAQNDSDDPDNIPEDAQQCPECGNILPKEALFCNSCGKKLEKPVLTDETSDENKDAAEQEAAEASAEPVKEEESFAPKENEENTASEEAAAQDTESADKETPAADGQEEQEEEPVKLCSECGNPIYGGDMFCSECGAKTQ